MARPRGFDRDRALEVAMGLFWRRGYEGVSIADLTKAMGISPPSLYAAFGDKLQIFQEAVTLYEERAGAPVVQALREAVSARDAMERLLCEAARQFTAQGGDRGPGCLVSTSLLTCAVDSEGAAEVVRARRAAARSVILARLRECEAAGEFPPGTDLNGLARFVEAVRHGLSVEARDGATEEELLSVVRVAMALWPVGARG